MIVTRAEDARARAESVERRSRSLVAGEQVRGGQGTTVERRAKPIGAGPGTGTSTLSLLGAVDVLLSHDHEPAHARAPRPVDRVKTISAPGASVAVLCARRRARGLLGRTTTSNVDAANDVYLKCTACVPLSRLLSHTSSCRTHRTSLHPAPQPRRVVHLLGSPARIPCGRRYTRRLVGREREADGQVRHDRSWLMCVRYSLSSSVRPSSVLPPLLRLRPLTPAQASCSVSAQRRDGRGRG
jgi:hypothetical protein